LHWCAKFELELHIIIGWKTCQQFYWVHPMSHFFECRCTNSTRRMPPFEVGGTKKRLCASRGSSSASQITFAWVPVDGDRGRWRDPDTAIAPRPCRSIMPHYTSQIIRHLFLNVSTFIVGRSLLRPSGRRIARWDADETRHACRWLEHGVCVCVCVTLHRQQRAL